VALVLVGVFVQLRLHEPSEFEKAEAVAAAAGGKAKKGLPLAKVLTVHLGDVLLAGGAFVANNTCFYIAITYVVAYGTSTLGIAKDTLLAAVMIASVLMIPFLILCGAVSDRFGRRGIFMAGAVLAGVWAFAMFRMIETTAPVQIIAAITVEMAFLSLMYGPQ